MTSLADESGLLTELRTLAAQGRHREVLERLHGLPVDALEGRTAFALLAAEAHGRLGDHAEAQRWTALALVAARLHGERQAELRALNYQGAIALRRGDVDEAEQRFADALELARAVQAHAVQARSLNNLGVIASLRGDPASALANYQLALAAYQQAGLVRGIAETHHNIGISWRERADYRRALQSAEQAVRLATQVKDDSLLGLALAGRAEIHVLMGDADLASAELQRAAEAYRRVQFEAGLPEVWRLQSAVARARGDLPKALQLLRQAAELAAKQGSAESLAAVERDLGAALEAQGDQLAARTARERAVALYQRLGATKAAQEMAALIAGAT
ncbi:MAG TPA: tetratricopeptide repeat protein [Gemmatimonadales bacterium]|nr:tetratricopeptide repeat protein [Gemmatimonadales bacterium]